MENFITGCKSMACSIGRSKDSQILTLCQIPVTSSRCERRYSRCSAKRNSTSSSRRCEVLVESAVMKTRSTERCVPVPRLFLHERRCQVSCFSGFELRSDTYQSPLLHGRPRAGQDQARRFPFGRSYSGRLRCGRRLHHSRHGKFRTTGAVNEASPVPRRIDSSMR